MTRLDSKFHLEGETVVKTSNGEPIDLSKEPVILFRGRDYLAVQVLLFYRQLCEQDGVTEYQMNTLEEMIGRFQAFALTSPTMKQPGCTRGM
jgi:hypothetical protein